MKNILKTNIKIIVLFFALTLVNCEKEDVEQTNSFTELGFTVKEYSFKTANKKLKFKEAYSKVIQGVERSAGQRSQERSVSEFSLDSTSVKEIEANGIITYTMLVNKEELEDHSFKNLVIQIDSLEEVKAYLITYNPTSMQYVEEHDSYSFEGTQEIERIDYDSSFLNLRMLDVECSASLKCDVDGEEHSAGPRCTGTYVVVECNEVGGNSSSGTGNDNVGDTTGDNGNYQSNEGSDNTNGGGSNTSSNTGTSANNVYTAIVTPKPKPLEEILECIPSLLDVSGAVNWLQENKYEAAKIKDFLQDEAGNCMLENYDFALEAIDAIIDQTNDINTWEDFVAEIIKRFGDVNAPYELKMKSEIFQSNGDRGSTYWQRDNTSNPIPYKYLIKLNPNPAHATKLFRAQAMIHEIIHAYFFSVVDDYLQTGDNTLANDFPVLWDWYQVKKYGDDDANSPHHETIALLYVDIMARALQEYQTGTPVPSGTEPETAYKDLAWVGLHTTTPYLNENNNPNLPNDADRLRINDRLFAELTNTTIINEVPLGGQCD